MDGIEVMRQFLLATTLCTALASAALAQVQPASVPAPVIYPTAASLSVSTGSARIALPAAQLQYPAALLVNAGPSEVFIVPGDNTTVATTAGIPIEPGGCVPVWVGASLLTGGVAPTNIAAITAGGASTLRVVQANSLAACGGAPGTVAATISGPVTTNDGGVAGTGISQPTGGSGLSGWLSGIYSKLSGTLTATISGALPAGTNSIGSVTTTPSATGAVAQIGPATGTISVTTNSLAVSLTLPGKVRFWNPQYIIGTSTPNPTPVQINYKGGDACGSPNATLSPGQPDDWVYIANTTQPTVCAPAAVTVEAQQ